MTSAPSRRQTEPISRPITPPPITTIFFGTSAQIERSGGGDDTLLVDLDPGQADDVGTGGDDDVLRLDLLDLAVLARHRDLAGGEDLAGAVEGVDLVLLEQEFDALGIALNRVILMGAHRLEIELGLAHSRSPVS